MFRISIALVAAVSLAACTTAQVEQVTGYQNAVQQACTIASTALSSAAGTPALSNPDVQSASVLVNSACGTEAAVAALVLSPTSVAWLNTLITTIKSGGKVVPPAPIANP